MKSLLAVGFGAVTLFATVVAFTQDAKVTGADANAAAAQSSMSTMAQMGEHMNRMQALHDRMMSAATPEERQQVMEEVRKEMQEGMAMMHDGGMMGGGMMRGKGESGVARSQMRMMMGPQSMTGTPNAPESPPQR
jgi:hypothetical protein